MPFIIILVMKIASSKTIEEFFERVVHHLQNDCKAEFLGMHVTKAQERKVQKLLQEAGFSEFLGPKKEWPSLFLSTQEWENNPYHQHVHLDYVKDNHFSFQKEKTAGFELFNSDEIQKDPKRELNDWMKLRAMDARFETLYLYQDEEDWMMDAPSEYSTNVRPAQKAFGKVLTFGLGIGYFLWFALENPKVEEVTVVEKSEAVISMFQRFIFPQFQSTKKVTFIQGDAYEYFHKEFIESFDYCYCDIWKSSNDGLACISDLLERYPLSLDQGDFWIEESCFETMWTLQFWYFHSLYHGKSYVFEGELDRYYKKIQLYYSRIEHTITKVTEIQEAIYDRKRIREILALQQ